MNTIDIAGKIIDKKYYEYAEKEFDEFYLVPNEMTFEEFNSYEPTEEDIPSIVESIRFWGTKCRPKGKEDTWNKLQREIANECYKIELMLYEMLGKAYREKIFTK